jgi:tetratricopeptide (TPR) repeat protein
MRYKRTQKSLPQIAQELGVEAVLEGSVLRAGDRVRVTAQLIGAARDEHLWAKSYEQATTDVFASQRMVARAIAEEIRRQIAPDEQARAIAKPAIPAQACESYLQGIYLFYQWRDRMPASREMLKKSVAHFETAIRLAPDYALAYAALANVYRWMAGHGAVHFYPTAEEMARRALELDETLDEAHAALAYTLLKYHWDWTAAEREFQRAIQIKPNTPFRHGYAMLLSMSGHHNHAVAEIKLAEQYDPLNLTLKVIAGLLFAYARRDAWAMEQLQNAAALDANVSIVHWATGVAHHHARRFDEAIIAFQKARAISPGSLFCIGDLACAHAARGDHDKARAILTEMNQLSSRKRVPPHAFALVHAGLGESAQALEWLERACDERSDFVTYLKVDARMDGLRNEPHFWKLLERVGLSGDDSRARSGHQRDDR